MQLFIICFTIFVFNTLLFAPAKAEGIHVYLKNMRLSAEHKQKLAADINRYRQADNLWDALREEFALPHYETIPAVQDKIDWYMSNQEYLLRSASRAAPYLYYILQQVKKKHLPAELVLLPIVESGYNPFSISYMGASGIWQLMPDTASGLGVKQDFWFDGRRDLIASTRAALNYLAYLQSFFEGNWLLAIAAYNTGEGNVLAAIKRNIREGRDTDFWSLSVAQQTRDYVPSVLALAAIISHPEQYPIYFPPVRNAPYLAQVDVGTQINLKFAAALAGISYRKLMQLNPGFNRTSMSNKGPYKLVLPIENIEQFAENLAMSPVSARLRWGNYKVKSGDTLISIARKYKTTVLALKQMNRIHNPILHPGKDLLIPNNLSTKSESALELLAKASNRRQRSVTLAAQKPAAAIAGLVKSNGKYTLQPGDTIYMIRNNDTIDGIAKRFKVDSQLLRIANQIKSNKLQSGKQIIVPTHAVMTAMEAGGNAKRRLRTQ